MNTIPAYAIAACLAVTAKRDARFYLMGVYVEQGALPAVVGTDGNVLAALRLSTGHWTLPTTIIPRDVCEVLAKWKGDITFGLGVIDGNLRATSGSQSVEFAPISGRYPDWRQVCRKAPDGPKVAAIDPTIMAAATKVGTILHKHCASRNRVEYHVTTTDKAATHIGLSRLPTGIACGAIVVMPLRNEKTEAPPGDVTGFDPLPEADEVIA